MAKNPAVDELDEQDDEWLTAANTRRLATETPLIGDWVVFPDRKEPARIANIWERDLFGSGCLQLAGHGGTFQLLWSGETAYTGTPGKTIPDELAATGKVLGAKAWIYHHSLAFEHNRVEVTVRARVWRSGASVGPARRGLM